MKNTRLVGLIVSVTGTVLSLVSVVVPAYLATRKDITAVEAGAITSAVVAGVGVIKASIHYDAYSKDPCGNLIIPNSLPENK